MGSLIPYPTALGLVAAVASLACFEELARNIYSESRKSKVC
jgi:hypothetical protein